jgi:hypothetical protein
MRVVDKEMLTVKGISKTPILNFLFRNKQNKKTLNLLIIYRLFAFIELGEIYAKSYAFNEF